MMREEDPRFESLFQRYYKRTVAFLIHVGFSVEDARDLAQDTFVRVYRNMETYRGGEWPFIRTTAHNIAKNYFRDRSTQKRTGTVIPIEDIADPVAPTQPPDEALIKDEETARFRAAYTGAIDALPKTLRQPFLLREQGYSYEEIAAILRITVNAVKSRLHEAKGQVREQLGEEWQGIDWPEAAGDRDEQPE